MIQIHRSLFVTLFAAAAAAVVQAQMMMMNDTMSPAPTMGDSGTMPPAMGGSGSGMNETTTPPAMDLTLAEIIGSDPELTTLAAAVNISDIFAAVDGSAGYYTVFA